ncbi:MAG TPA: hypothetical protein VMD55_06720 [Terracidiphilus sp.]|nr:hypothetical protein [Terracidiphilus sp.]
MKRTTLFVGLVLAVALPCSLQAQSAEAASGGGGQSAPGESNYTLNHAEIGAYADYFRFAPSSSTSTNFVGVGGRAAFNVNPNIALEGELNYDFAKNFTTSSTITNGTTTTTTFTTTGLRPITGLFGPKFQFGTSGDFRAFVTGKLGFVDFTTTNPNNVTGTQFSNAIAGVGGGGTHLAFYPGGGIEGFWGPIGLRLEAGDEIYLNNGTYNNLRVTVGPTIRF